MPYRNVVVLTGAGISQAAGLPTYRGAGGLWSNPDLAALADVSALRTRRAEATAMFWQFRRAGVLRSCVRPNRTDPRLSTPHVSALRPA